MVAIKIFVGTGGSSLYRKYGHWVVYTDALGARLACGRYGTIRIYLAVCR